MNDLLLLKSHSFQPRKNPHTSTPLFCMISNEVIIKSWIIKKYCIQNKISIEEKAPNFKMIREPPSLIFFKNVKIYYLIYIFDSDLVLRMQLIII